MVKKQLYMTVLLTDPPNRDVNFSADAKDLASKVKAVEGRELTLQPDGGSGNGSPFRFASETQYIDVWAGPSTVPFPGIPFEKLLPLPEWHAIKSVFHAAGMEKDIARSELANVCFGKTAVGATDEASIAFARVKLGAHHLFPAAAFEKWPSKTAAVTYFLDDTRGYFLCADELRVIPVRRGWFPPLQQFLGDFDGYTWCDFDKKELLNAVKEVADSSPRKQLRIHGSGTNPFTVSAVPADTQATVRFLNPESRMAEVNLYLDAKRVLACLRSINLKEVRVGWSPDEWRPLRIQTPVFMEDIYPLKEV